MTRNILERAKKFADFHKADLFVMPNCWDVGSAKMLVGVGASAIATASAGLAGTHGLNDGGIGRDEALAHAAAIVAAVDVPVSADLENCYADDPEGVAETVRRAAEIGLAGCSVEDKVHGTSDFYPFELAVERVKAAVETVSALGRPFVLTARADGALGGGYDVNEAVRRAHAFADEGAGCIFVPGIPETEVLRDLCASAGAPVSHLTGIGQFGDITHLRSLGVRRVSTGPFLYRASMGHAAEQATALLNDGKTATLSNPFWPSALAAIRAADQKS